MDDQQWLHERFRREGIVKNDFKSKKLDITTRAIHIGSEPDEETGSIIPPIYQTSTYLQNFSDIHAKYEYTRSHNPTRTRLEDCLASLEGGGYALTTSSGMAACMLIMHYLPKGSTILCGHDVYGGTYRLFTTIFHDFHHFRFVDMTEILDVEILVEQCRPDLIWVESPTNPLLQISDIGRLALIAKDKGSLLLVDNTFMSPYFQNPLALGADIILHSTTKYINGHSDIIGGCLVVDQKNIYDDLFVLQNSLGPCPSPFDSWLTLRGVKTLGVRMEAHQKNALRIASWLEEHSCIEKVLYPGLPSHPQYLIGKNQATGSGGMISFFLKGDALQARKFLKHLKIFSFAESLGGVESLIEHPVSMTHASVPKEVREKLGITDTLIRLSVGIEHCDDLIDDLQHALKSVS